MGYASPQVSLGGGGGGFSCPSSASSSSLSYHSVSPLALCRSSSSLLPIKGKAEGDSHGEEKKLVELSDKQEVNVDVVDNNAVNEKPENETDNLSSVVLDDEDEEVSIVNEEDDDKEEYKNDGASDGGE